MGNSPVDTVGPSSGGKRRPHGFRTQLGRRLRWLHEPIAAVAAKITIATLTRVPTWTVAPIAGTLGRIMYYSTLAHARPRALRNLAIAFPEMDAAGRKRRYKTAYLEQARCMMDALAAARRPAWIASRMHGWEEARARVRGILEQNKGMVLLTGHVGAWEIMGLVVTRHFPMTFVAKRSKNAAINRIVEAMRTSQGGRVHYHNDPPRPLLAALRKGEIAGFVGDRAFKGTAVVEVPYFGRTTRIPTAPFALARTTGSPLLFVCFLRTERGYEPALSGPIYVPRNADRDQSVRDAACRWVAFLEEQIRTHPHNWVPLAGHWKKSKRDRTASAP